MPNSNTLMPTNAIITKATFTCYRNFECKYTASRAQYKTNSFVFIAKAQRVLLKYQQVERNTKQIHLFYCPLVPPVLKGGCFFVV